MGFCLPIFFSFKFFQLKYFSNKSLLLFFFFYFSVIYANTCCNLEWSKLDDKCLITFNNKTVSKVILDNKIDVFICSDPSFTHSSAAITIARGSCNDPSEHMGMAHFVEHLLFLGNKAHPKENSFSQFVLNHGGLCNAFTEKDSTTYFFSVPTLYFAECLKLFKQLFIAPLFKDACIQREINVVDQEFYIHKQDEGFAYDELCKITRNPKNPFNQFAAGNINTLSKVNHVLAKEWYEQNYSANLMRMIIASPMQIRELEVFTDDFSDIPNRNLSFQKSSNPLMLANNFGQLLYLDCKIDTQQINLEWEIPIEFYHHINYLDFLFSSDQAFCLKHSLEKKGLAQSISTEHEALGSSLVFKLIILPTNKGIQKIDELLSCIFQYISLIKKHGLSEAIFNDWQQDIIKNKKKLKGMNPTILVIQLSKDCFQEHFDTFPQKNTVGDLFDASKLNDLFTRLKASTCQFIIMANNAVTKVAPQKEGPFFKCRYAENKIPLKSLFKWDNIQPDKTMKLPYLKDLKDGDHDDNTDYHCEINEKSPQLIINEKGLKAFLITDNTFNSSHFFSSIHIKTPHFDPQKIKDHALIDFYIQWLKDKLLNSTFIKNHPDFSLDCYYESCGIKIILIGQIEALNKEINSLFKEIQFLPISQNLFKSIKKNLVNSFDPENYQDSLNEAFCLKNLVLYKNNISNTAITKEIEKITKKECEYFAKNIFKSSHIQAFFYGNITKEMSLEFISKLKDSLNSEPCSLDDCPQDGYLLLNSSEGPFEIVKQSKQPFNINILVIQNEKYTPKDMVMMELLKFSLNSPFFNDLRTKNQTCYELYVTNNNLGYTLTLDFIIRSTSHEPYLLNEYTEKFIEKVLDKLTTKIVSKQQFEKTKNLHQNYFAVCPKNFEESAEILQQFTTQYHQDLFWNAKIKKSIENITYEEFTEFTKRLLNKSNKRRLSIGLKGNFTNIPIKDEVPNERLNFIRENGIFITQLQKAA